MCNYINSLIYFLPAWFSLQKKKNNSIPGLHLHNYVILNLTLLGPTIKIVMLKLPYPEPWL